MVMLQSLARRLTGHTTLPGARCQAQRCAVPWSRYLHALCKKVELQRSERKLRRMSNRPYVPYHDEDRLGLLALGLKLFFSGQRAVPAQAAQLLDSAATSTF